MKIKGAYVLTLRSIKRMIAVLATVFSMLCPAATTPDEVLLADRYAFASQCLMHMRGSLNGLGDCPRILKHSEVKHHGIHGSPHSRDTESSNERALRAFRWQESMFNMI